jgi:HlyD family secretion protein
MQIDSSVAEADVGGIVEGQDVDFTVDAYPYRTFYGTVVQVRNAPTNSSNVISYDCVVSVTNSDYKLKPGMTANISFIIAQRENALIIPNGALRFRPPENAMVLTNSAAAQTATATNSRNFAGTSGGQGHRSGRTRGERPIFHTVFVLSGTGNAAKLQVVQIKTGISDGISTEVLSGLDAGAQVVTSVVTTGTQAARPASPIGGPGGFPRMR